MKLRYGEYFSVMSVSNTFTIENGSPLDYPIHECQTERSSYVTRYLSVSRKQNKQKWMIDYNDRYITVSHTVFKRKMCTIRRKKTEKKY